MGPSTTTTASRTFLQRATDLVTRGFSVIPLAPREKKPVGLGATARTKNFETIQTWANQWPDANVGVCADDEITILESDDAVRFKAILAEMGIELPETLTGGASENRPHWFYKRTAACGSECVTVPGLFEFRNNNQYVVGPGSIHPSGAEYRWWKDVPIVPMTEELVNTLRTLADQYDGRGEPTGPQGIQTGPYAILRDAYLRMLEPEDLMGIDGLEIGEDERHYTLRSLAGLLHDGKRTADEITEILCNVRDEYCATSGRQVSTGEIQALADYAVRREPTQVEPYDLPIFAIGTRVFRTAEAMTKWAAENIDSLDIKPKAPPVKPSEWRGIFHTYEEFCNAPPVKFAINGVLQESAITLIGGVPGHGKTFVMLSMARALLTGTPLFGHAPFAAPEASQRVVYLCPEVGQGPFSHRLKLFRLGNYIKAGTLVYRTLSSLEEVPLTDPRMLAAVKGADVFLDTAVRFMEGDENSAAEQKVFSDNVFNLLKAGARTVTGAHHSPKRYESEWHMALDNVLRGSGEIGGMASTVWGLKQLDKVANRIYMGNIKPRDFEPCEPFIIEGRPYIDQVGDFKMVKLPGQAGDLEGYKPRLGGRPRAAEKLNLTDQILEMSRRRISNRKIAEALGISKDAVRRTLLEKAGMGGGAE